MNTTLVSLPAGKVLLTGAAGLAVLGTVAACAPSDQGTSETTAPSTSPAASDPATSTESVAGTSTYRDGQYEEDGNYTSPNGQEKLGVQLTVDNGVVTAVELTTYPSNPNTQRFQDQFASGIDAEVVGKNLNEINVGKVSGSSLTSGGFNEALAKIKADASDRQD